MPKLLQPRPRRNTVGDLLNRLGVPASRVCLDPPPGKATKRDLLKQMRQNGTAYELIERTLVEKAMGSPESFLGMLLGRLMGNYLDTHDVGYLCGADGLVELIPNLVLVPDVAFYSWSRRQERTVPLDPIGKVVPHLVVEILSPSNTRKEMARKRGEYFSAGVEVVWEIDAETRTAEIFLADGTKEYVPETGTLLGGTRAARLRGETHETVRETGKAEGEKAEEVRRFVLYIRYLTDRATFSRSKLIPAAVWPVDVAVHNALP